MKSFRINDYIEIVCESQRTRYGFRHLATLLINGIERDTAKCTYQNRTWESYEFQSVLRKIADSDVLKYWDRLSEDEKTKRLDAVISLLEDGK